MANSKFYLFIDESGISNLKSTDRCFILATVIINKSDFEIIQGYLRLLKRKFLIDELISIHSTDLFERPYQKYRKLVKPKNILNAFLHELKTVLSNIPYKACIYYVNKEKLKSKLRFEHLTPQQKGNLNDDLPYEMCSLEAIFNFASFLKKHHAIGEIIIESRLLQDGLFVSYFDHARKNKLPGGVSNSLYRDVRERINSLKIANKLYASGGLEIADICSYIARRKIIGDPKNKIKADKSLLKGMYTIISRNCDVTPNEIMEVV